MQLAEATHDRFQFPSFPGARFPGEPGWAPDRDFIQGIPDLVAEPILPDEKEGWFVTVVSFHPGGGAGFHWNRKTNQKVYAGWDMAREYCQEAPMDLRLYTGEPL